MQQCAYFSRLEKFFFRFLADINCRKLVNNSRIESVLNALSKRNFDDTYIYSIVIWVVEFLKNFCNIPYHKVASSNTSCLEAHAGLFRLLNPVKHGTGHFPPWVFVKSHFVSWFFFKTFQTLLEVKIEINRVILKSCPTH